MFGRKRSTPGPTFATPRFDMWEMKVWCPNDVGFPLRWRVRSYSGGKDRWGDGESPTASEARAAAMKFIERQKREDAVEWEQVP